MKRLVLFYILTFTIYSGFSQSITSAEYFFNTDPGVGNGTSLNVSANSGNLTQTFSIPTNTLSDGFNSFYIRTLNSDGNWSLYERQTFYTKNFVSNNITAAEYFFNTDPGVGNGNALSVDSNTGQLAQTYTIATTSLSEGFHSFYLRTRDNGNTWSLYDRQIIYIKDFDLTPDEVSSAEYFIDTDPGVGNGTSVSFGNSQSSQVLNIDTTGLSEGDHLFYIRVQDANGDWSIYDTALFTIDSSLSTENSLYSSIKLTQNPFVDKLKIDIPDHMEIKEVKIYDALGQKAFYSSENNAELNLSHLKSGLYILNLNTNVGSTSFKILKK
ncbi:T9SS type A sorting domain-containing protein [Seonamhaeicola marinus]|nr:T9SS type A sorting domain-containing protein [Seonamhaeicola marinus]